MFSKHGGHRVSVPEPCAYIPPSIKQNRHAEDKLRQRPFPARPNPAQPSPAPTTQSSSETRCQLATHRARIRHQTLCGLTAHSLGRGA